MSVQSFKLSETVNNVLNYWMDGSYPGCGKCDNVNSPDPWFIFYYLKIQKCYQILYLRKLFVGLNSMLSSTDILSSGYKLICSGCRWHLINSIYTTDVSSLLVYPMQCVLQFSHRCMRIKTIFKLQLLTLWFVTLMKQNR